MVLSGAIAPVSAAQAPATQPAWVSANGGVSGIEMWALARDPDKPAIRYAGGPQGFVRSVDSGRTWVRSNQGLPPDCAINAILPLRGQSATLLVGCSGADYENGLYGSADRGDHWQLAGSGMLANTAVYAIAQSLSLIHI